MPASIGKPFFPAAEPSEPRDAASARRGRARSIRARTDWHAGSSALEPSPTWRPMTLSKRTSVQLAGWGSLAALPRSPAAARRRRRRHRRAPAATPRRRRPPSAPAPAAAGAAEDRLRLRRPGRRRRLDLRPRQRPQGAREGVRRQDRDHASSRRCPRRPMPSACSATWSSQGNKLIFGTTFGYMEPMLKVAADLPGRQVRARHRLQDGRQHAHLRQPHLRRRVHGRRDRRRHDQDQHARRRRLGADPRGRSATSTASRSARSR